MKTLAAVALLTVLTTVRPDLLRFEHLNPLAGAVLAGMTAGLGLLAIFRHGASLGGFGALAYWLQDRHGVRAGWTQMAVDGVVFALAVFTLAPGAALLFGDRGGGDESRDRDQPPPRPVCGDVGRRAPRPSP